MAVTLVDWDHNAYNLAAGGSDWSDDSFVAVGDPGDLVMLVVGVLDGALVSTPPEPELAGMLVVGETMDDWGVRWFSWSGTEEFGGDFAGLTLDSLDGELGAGIMYALAGNDEDVDQGTLDVGDFTTGTYTPDSPTLPDADIAVLYWVLVDDDDSGTDVSWAALAGGEGATQLVQNEATGGAGNGPTSSIRLVTYSTSGLKTAPTATDGGLVPVSVTSVMTFLPSYMTETPPTVTPDFNPHLKYLRRYASFQALPYDLTSLRLR